VAVAVAVAVAAGSTCCSCRQPPPAPGAAAGTAAPGLSAVLAAPAALLGSPLLLPGGVPGPAELRRARAVQQYLEAFEGQGLPVVTVQYGNFVAAIDRLHYYVLQCIEAAMEVLGG